MIKSGRYSKKEDIMIKTLNGKLALLTVGAALITSEAKADRTIIIHDRTETTREEKTTVNHE